MKKLFVGFYEDCVLIVSVDSVVNVNFSRYNV